VFVDGSPDYGHSQDARIVACREDIAGIGLGQKLIKLLGRDCDGDYIRIALIEEKTKWANPITEEEIKEAEKKRAEKIEASLKEQDDFLAPKEEKSSEEQTVTPEGNDTQVTTTECTVPTETPKPSEGTEVNNVVDVKEFRGKYAFLSNMYKCQVKVDGIVYQSAEAAYQAQKTTDIDIRHEFSKLGPVEAKEKGRHIQALQSFNRIDAMGKVLIAKFSQNKDLLDELLKINGVIVEGNTWNDTYWGVCNGKGENMLGKMLSRIRDNVLAKTKSVPPAAPENK